MTLPKVSVVFLQVTSARTDDYSKSFTGLYFIATLYLNYIIITLFQVLIVLHFVLTVWWVNIRDRKIPGGVLYDIAVLILLALLLRNVLRKILRKQWPLKSVTLRDISRIFTWLSRYNLVNGKHGRVLSRIILFLRANQCTWLPISYQFCNFLVLALGVGAVVAQSDHAISELVS